jgi:hypothetical protein
LVRDNLVTQIIHSDDDEERCNNCRKSKRYPRTKRKSTNQKLGVEKHKHDTGDEFNDRILYRDMVATRTTLAAKSDK